MVMRERDTERENKLYCAEREGEGGREGGERGG